MKIKVEVANEIDAFGILDGSQSRSAGGMALLALSRLRKLQAVLPGTTEIYERADVPAASHRLGTPCRSSPRATGKNFRQTG